MSQMEVMVGFVSKPKVIRDGQAAMCVLRPPSAKELSQKEKRDKAAASQSADSKSKSTQSKSSPVSNTDTTEESIQQ